MSLISGVADSPAMIAAAAADFGNGISWILPPDRYLFSNADLTLHLHRPPLGDWIGVQAQTQADPGGTATTVSRLYDVHGPIGLAAQSLLLRERRPAR